MYTKDEITFFKFKFINYCILNKINKKKYFHNKEYVINIFLSFYLILHYSCLLIEYFFRIRTNQCF